MPFTFAKNIIWQPAGRVNFKHHLDIAASCVSPSFHRGFAPRAQLEGTAELMPQMLPEQALLFSLLLSSHLQSELMVRKEVELQMNISRTK